MKQYDMDYEQASKTEAASVKVPKTLHLEFGTNPKNCSMRRRNRPFA